MAQPCCIVNEWNLSEYKELDIHCQQFATARVRDKEKHCGWQRSMESRETKLMSPSWEYGHRERHVGQKHTQTIKNETRPRRMVSKCVVKLRSSLMLGKQRIRQRALSKQISNTSLWLEHILKLNAKHPARDMPLKEILDHPARPRHRNRHEPNTVLCTHR